MYDKICKVCGGSFQAANPRYVICSDECRKAYAKTQSRKRSAIYYSTAIGKFKHKKYNRDRYIPVGKHCVDCGELLPDGRASYCLDCLLKDYAAGNKVVAGQRLACRGYDKAMILAEIKERGIPYAY